MQSEFLRTVSKQLLLISKQGNNASEKPMPVLYYVHTEGFPDVFWWNFLCSSLSWHWAPWPITWLHLLCSPSSGIYTHWSEFPQHPFLQPDQSQFSQSLLVGVVLHSLNHLRSLPRWSRNCSAYPMRKVSLLHSIYKMQPVFYKLLQQNSNCHFHVIDIFLMIWNKLNSN